jgi:hypothetical protein
MKLWALLSYPRQCNLIPAMAECIHRELCGERRRNNGLVPRTHRQRILLLERGDYLPGERENWDSRDVFVDARYQAKETWYGSDGRAFRPCLHYFVGHNSKRSCGGVLLRLREPDFQERFPRKISKKSGTLTARTPPSR